MSSSPPPPSASGFRSPPSSMQYQYASPTHHQQHHQQHQPQHHMSVPSTPNTPFPPTSFGGVPADASTALLHHSLMMGFDVLGDTPYGLTTPPSASAASASAVGVEAAIATHQAPPSTAAFLQDYGTGLAFPDFADADFSAMALGGGHGGGGSQAAPAAAAAAAAASGLGLGSYDPLFQSGLIHGYSSGAEGSNDTAIAAGASQQLLGHALSGGSEHHHSMGFDIGSMSSMAAPARTLVFPRDASDPSQSHSLETSIPHEDEHSSPSPSPHKGRRISVDEVSPSKRRSKPTPKALESRQDHLDSPEGSRPRRAVRSPTSRVSKSLLVGQSTETLEWIGANYQEMDGVSLPRSSLYENYLKWCGRIGYDAMTAASFGKLVKQRFPDLKTRRLGTRGQSKYHYFGIGVRPGVDYYAELAEHQVAESSRGTRSSPGSDQAEAPLGRTVANSLSESAKLPDFPGPNHQLFQAGADLGTVDTFVMMYRTHCQRILDALSRANFDELQGLLIHFWRGIPKHFRTALAEPALINHICVCDTILYHRALTVLLPNLYDALPTTLLRPIRLFANGFVSWLATAMDGVEEALIASKLGVARTFSNALKRKTTLNHLIQATRTMLHTSQSHMSKESQRIDIQSILRESRAHLDIPADYVTSKVHGLFLLLETHATPVEAFLAWMLDFMLHCVDEAHFVDSGKLFLLKWTMLSTKVVRDLTLRSSPSHGAFNVLRVLLDEYILFLLERRATHGETMARFKANRGALPMPRVMQAVLNEMHSLELETGSGKKIAAAAGGGGRTKSPSPHSGGGSSGTITSDGTDPGRRSPQLH